MIEWVLLVSLAILLAASLRKDSRRRLAMNRCLHEVRRPLQALALTVPEPGPGPGTSGARPLVPGHDGHHRPEVSSTPVWQAIRAVGDLDRQLNGGPVGSRRNELIAGRLMVDAAVRRWQSRAHLSGSEIRLRWTGPDALVRGDGAALSAALENLILNAIEHGGPHVTVNCLTVTRNLRIEVLDDGVARRAPGRRDSPKAVIAKLRGDRRHGHGLEVAGRVTDQHGGRLETEFAATGSKVAIVLPITAAATARRVPVRVNW